MSRLIRNLFAAVTNRSPSTRTSPPRTSRLGVERMEERDTPTTFPMTSQALTELNRFIENAANVEYYQPTLMSETILQDLDRIDSDAWYGNGQRVYANLQALGQHLIQEANYVAAYNLHTSYSLLAYDAIVSDLLAVNFYMEVGAGAWGAASATSSWGTDPWSEQWMPGLNYGTTQFLTSTLSNTNYANTSAPWSTASIGTGNVFGGEQFYPNATAMGLTYSAGQGGALIGQYFNNPGLAGLYSGNLTGVQANQVLAPYLGTDLNSFYNSLANNVPGLGGMLSVIDWGF